MQQKVDIKLSSHIFPRIQPVPVVYKISGKQYRVVTILLIHVASPSRVFLAHGVNKIAF